MEVEFTARQVKISKALRTQAEEGMERIARILGKSARASVTFSTQKRLQIAEVTIQARMQTIVAAGKADTLECGVARGHRARRKPGSPSPRQANREQTAAQGGKGAHCAAGEQAQGSRRPAGRGWSRGKVARARRKAAAEIAVHSFPARKEVVEPHILTNGQAIALKAMTIEEAVKEAEFRDRDLLVFRNPAGELFVLHRRRDGQMELVEIS